MNNSASVYALPHSTISTTAIPECQEWLRLRDRNPKYRTRGEN
jgi:hypothetical protein